MSSSLSAPESTPASPATPAAPAEPIFGGEPCFHCGEPCPAHPRITIEREGRILPLCCEGCRAVSGLIFASGLAGYYRFREGEARRADTDLDALEAAWRSCDEREALWGAPTGDDTFDLLLQTEGVHCAACAWLIRSRLEPLDGIDRVQVDIGSGYTRIAWNPRVTRLSAIARELARIGYRPHLPLAEDEERGRLRERREAMLRLGVAGLGMMQVMMYAVGLYAGEALGISAGAERFLEWTSLLVTLPVVLYSGRPFFTGAVAGLRHGRMGMDVPVALAIAIAFVASCVNFFRGEGAVYFDSVVMFVFFLSAARTVQLFQRHRSLQASTALARLLPEWAHRITERGEDTVLLAELAVGDRLRVRPGEAFPADGVIRAGSTCVDESLLTGESRWLERHPGDAVVGGSLNRDQSVEIEVTATGQATTVSALGRLLLQARGRGSRAAGLAERTAAWFVAAVLVAAAGTGIAWWMLDPARALPTLLAVLVVSCPCALSLAFPAALAAASRRLLNEGILLSRPDALETLANADLAVFDKTGTLTAGQPSVDHVDINPEHPESQRLGESGALALGAALERHSAHPLARAFRDADGPFQAEQVHAIRHRGLEGQVDGGTWRIGSAALVRVGEGVGEGADEAINESGDESGDEAGAIWLGNEQGWLARFTIADRLREGCEGLAPALSGRGLECLIASGDARAPVRRVAERLGMTDFHAGQSPEAKMALVAEGQARGRTVLMVGDGVNDGPVLATADVSMTVQGATELANSAADLVLTDASLAGVATAIDLARATRRVVRQNIAWAVGYNLLALPLAAGGLLAPWMAALGMSASSLLVVANSARLARWRRRPNEGMRRRQANESEAAAA